MERVEFVGLERLTDGLQVEVFVRVTDSSLGLAEATAEDISDLIRGYMNEQQAEIDAEDVLDAQAAYSELVAQLRRNIELQTYPRIVLPGNPSLVNQAAVEKGAYGPNAIYSPNQNAGLNSDSGYYPFPVEGDAEECR